MLYRLKEDLLLCNDHFGNKTNGGIAKAGMTFELLHTPSPKKKKYKLLSVGIKFPYYLYLRENDFQRYFEKIENNA